jgi:hypothetical protein
MNDPGQVVQYVFNTTEVEWRDVSLLTYDEGTSTYNTSMLPAVNAP